METKCLRKVSPDSEILIGPTTGLETIETSRDVFRNFVDWDFKQPEFNVASHETPVTQVQVYEAIVNATTRKMFESFGVTLDHLIFTQGQVRLFCKDHSALLRDEGYPTFFLIRNAVELCTPGATVFPKGLGIWSRFFSAGVEWKKDLRIRVVVPDSVTV